MSEHRSVWDRLSEELTADLSVSVAAALAAVPTLFAVAALTGRTDAPLYVAIDVAVFVPWVYDSHWPESYDGVGSAVWALSAALVTVGLFVGAYALFSVVVAEAAAAAGATVATVLTQYALAVAFERLRRRA